ncbi:MAG: hypothetical protein MK102_14800 [Fuerstiella sp.]|nr:hypothetical protein [Fuerstiella sp.]
MLQTKKFTGAVTRFRDIDIHTIQYGHLLVVQRKCSLQADVSVLLKWTAA